MTTTQEMLAEGRREQVWEKYCGFQDLNVEQFMQIQKRLLQEQIQLLGNCKLGQHLFNGQPPKSVNAFLNKAPLTTYDDYLDYLPTKRNDALPMKPKLWMRTSGKTGGYGGKWVPCTDLFYDQIGRYMIATIILSSARSRGDVRLAKDDVLLYTVAPPPYVSGTAFRAGGDQFPLRFVPPVVEAEAMGFQERMEKGFALSLDTGIDYFMGLASVLVRIGEAFADGGGGGASMSKDMLKPRTLYRLINALVRSKLKGRPLKPQDIWNPKGMIVSGMDVQVYKSRVKDLWGLDALEAYACTEFGTIALQSWGARSKGLTLAPDSAFWEFIPEADYRIWKEDKQYQPKVLLFDQLTTGRYVIVGTSFYGGAFVRYVLGDLINVISLKDDKVDIQLPQIVMESRADDIIDLGSLVLLSERSIWRAIGDSEFDIGDWVAHKEFNGTGDPILHMYVEGKNLPPTGMSKALDTALANVVDDYSGYEEIMGVHPMKVTILSSGTFMRYLEQKQAEGADLGHWKPPRMQPSNEIIQRLLSISNQLAD